MINNQKKNVYFTSDGSMVRKPLKQDIPNSNKLDKLRRQLIKYAHQYEANLREKGLEEERIKSLSFEWVEQTLRHYEVNFGDALDSVIAYLEYKIENYQNEQNVNEKTVKY